MERKDSAAVLHVDRRRVLSCVDKSRYGIIRRQIGLLSATLGMT